MSWPIAPMKATTGRLPHGEAWMYEPKWDGHRAIVRIRTSPAGPIVDAISSSGQPRIERWPWLADLGALFDLGRPQGGIILDGEVIAQGADGTHSFQAVGRSDRDHTFVVFDILSIDGGDLADRPWHERRGLLESAVGPAARAAGRIVVTPVTDDGDALMTATRATGFEGVIAKRADSKYLIGRRSPNWVKVKHHFEQEFVIGGYLIGDGSRSMSFGSLLLGVYDGDLLRFAGAVGSGFNDVTLRELRTQLRDRETTACPFDPVPKLVRGKARWVRPELVAQVRFGEWTDDAHLRHPVYLGLRDDKPATNVMRERGGPE
jgi:bifunctional non-homologous end joining protein LigD